MIDEMKEADLPEPVLKNEREDFVVTFYNGEYPELYPEELIQKQKMQKEPKKNPRRTQEEPKKNPSNIHEKDILDFCREPRSAMEICTKFGFKSIKPFKKNHLKPLLDKKMLVMTIPDKPTSKNQKYIVNSYEKGDYTKEKYENPEELTIEDFEKILKNK